MIMSSNYHALDEDRAGISKNSEESHWCDAEGHGSSPRPARRPREDHPCSDDPNADRDDDAAPPNDHRGMAMTMHEGHPDPPGRAHRG